MEFIKKNYEKIILSLVLLGLMGVLAFMPVMIYYDQQRMKDYPNIIPRKPEPLPPLDLSRQTNVMDRLQSSRELDFSTTNRLFNPVLWQKTKDGKLIKIDNDNKVGPRAAIVAKISPLYFSIALDSVTTNALGTPPRYAFSIVDETAPYPVLRRPRHHYGSKGEPVTDKAVSGKNEGFFVTTNATADPDELVLKLADTGEMATLSKDKPFQRVDGYSADVKYPLENLSRTGLRVGDHLAFAGDDYNIIAIDQNDVILLAQSNQKKYTLRYAP